MLTLKSGDVTVVANSANKLFKRAKVAGIDFTDYTVYAPNLILAIVRVKPGGAGYASRAGSPVWQASFDDTIQNVRLFIETHRLRTKGKFSKSLVPLVVGLGI